MEFRRKWACEYEGGERRGVKCCGGRRVLSSLVAMRLSMIVNPFTDRNLQLAAQVGVSDIVLTYPGPGLAPLLDARRRVEAFGMRLTHIERKIPHLKFVHDLPGRGEQVEAFKGLIRHMAEAGMEVLCYNWMPDEDWQRTSCDVLERGGAKVTEFNLAHVAQNVTDADGQPPQPTSAAQLWGNLERFLNEVLPVAEDAGIKLALHPDDPPLPELRGQPRIVISNEAYRRVVDLAPSSSNGICYCVGSLHPAGVDVIEGISQLGEKIFFFHARNVRGVASHFVETWHDTGEIDLAAVVRTLKKVGYRDTIRPDHAPSMAGETNETPGYEMLGRLFAAGYLRGLIQAA
jgi:mannonate dehydratase